jgi:hypothetical protein
MQAYPPPRHTHTHTPTRARAHTRTRARTHARTSLHIRASCTSVGCSLCSTDGTGCTGLGLGIVCAVTRVRAARRILQAPSGMRHGALVLVLGCVLCRVPVPLCVLNRAGGVVLWSCLCCMPRFPALPRHKPRTHSNGCLTGGSAAHSMIQGHVCMKLCTQRPRTQRPPPPHSARSVPCRLFWKAILKFVPNP